MTNDAQKNWGDYTARELAAVVPILKTYGITLDADQPHIRGERYLMQAVTTESGKKIILLGRMDTTGMRVVIKATRDVGGMRELTHERTCRAVLNDIKFAYRIFSTPKEILFVERNGFLLSVQAYIEQECAFLERPLREQFFFALRAFEAQEGAHATTYEHVQLIKKTFGAMNVEDYLERFAAFKANILSHADWHQFKSLLTETEDFLQNNQKTIDQYSGFLTHTDFVPHNFRVVENDMFLLDYSSLRFGNKYEGWARFLNFMILYNPELVHALTAYVRDNRTSEESQSLKLMRVYRLGELLSYYVDTLGKSAGDLHALNTARIEFWSKVLSALMQDAPLDEKVLRTYRETRDSLRSADEKKRQIGLH